MKHSSKPKQLSIEVKETAVKAGANLVGIVSAEDIDAFPSLWVGWTIQEYTKKTRDIMSDAKSLVVFGYHVWDDILEAALKKGDRWMYPGYFPLLIIGQKISHHIKKKGYEAIPFPASLSYKRLAQLAGLGTFGKNALIVNPKFGPWIRLGVVLTNADMAPDKPFEEDLCGDCKDCLEACPIEALKPYHVDSSKCLVGIHLTGTDVSKYADMLKRFEPSLTKNAHLMCMECQKACRYGINERNA